MFKLAAYGSTYIETYSTTMDVIKKGIAEVMKCKKFIVWKMETNKATIGEYNDRANNQTICVTK